MNDLDDDERVWIEDCRRAMSTTAARWESEGKAFTWFSSEPAWQKGAPSRYWSEQPSRPCRISYRLTLIGGGQVQIIEAHVANPSPAVAEFGPTFHETTVARVYAHGAAEVVRMTAGVEFGHTGEIAASALVYLKPRDTARAQRLRDVAARAAETVAAAMETEEAFAAMLDPSNGCAMCGRPLRDEISKLVAIGPDCAKQHRIDHTLEAASRRLVIRRRILGASANE